jgi:hypothetical protein
MASQNRDAAVLILRDKVLAQLIDRAAKHLRDFHSTKVQGEQVEAQALSRLAREVERAIRLLLADP